MNLNNIPTIWQIDGDKKNIKPSRLKMRQIKKNRYKAKAARKARKINKK